MYLLVPLFTALVSVKIYHEHKKFKRLSVCQHFVEKWLPYYSEKSKQAFCKGALDNEDARVWHWIKESERGH